MFGVERRREQVHLAVDGRRRVAVHFAVEVELRARVGIGGEADDRALEVCDAHGVVRLDPEVREVQRTVLEGDRVDLDLRLRGRRAFRRGVLDRRLVGGRGICRP